MVLLGKCPEIRCFNLSRKKASIRLLGNLNLKVKIMHGLLRVNPVSIVSILTFLTAIEVKRE